MAANPNMQILGLQAIPRLAERKGIKLNGFLTYSDLYGVTAEQFQIALERCRETLDQLTKISAISWWDVYSNSDIGMERLALAKDIALEGKDTVLELGCGRGYFTVAAAKLSKRVVGLDVMDGLGRRGWWTNFNSAIALLNLGQKVSGCKADAQAIPLPDAFVKKVVAVHSIRNFMSKTIIQNIVREMYRVLSNDGEMTIAENISTANNKSQEAHLVMLKCKSKYDWGDLFYFSQEELLRLLEEAGVKNAQVKVVDYNLSAAPPLFVLNTSRLRKGQVEQ
ncbi:MAG: methyltransferase domain-containing protein, partial [Chloroflexota bacterium]